uniref:Uncharacterized protein n=1 Tax=Physcomitrium patens TaxID=3218 RepID=A0A2K1KML6_PHYPA|nr:hypothetical protein PHYPA_005915 [Physcomitrium patens]
MADYLAYTITELITNKLRLDPSGQFSSRSSSSRGQKHATFLPPFPSLSVSLFLSFFLSFSTLPVARRGLSGNTQSWNHCAALAAAAQSWFITRMGWGGAQTQHSTAQHSKQPDLNLSTWVGIAILALHCFGCVVLCSVVLYCIAWLVHNSAW